MPLQQKNFSDIITVARNTAGWCWNSSGSLVQVAANQPRFDYDPVTLAIRGLLIEEQRTNYFRNNSMQGAVVGTPGTIPTNWGTVNNGLSTSVVAVGTEDGIPYVDIRFFGTSTGGSLGIRPEGTSIAAASGQVWTSAFYARIVAGSLANVIAARIQNTGLTSGSAANADSSQTEIITALGAATNLRGNRFASTITLADATTAFVRPQLAMAFNTGSAIDVTIRVGAPQAEQGAFATSTILTTNAAVTRANDSVTINTLSPWFNPTEGTIYAEYSPSIALPPAPANQFVFQVSADSGNYLALFRDNTTGRDVARIRNGAVDQMFVYASATPVSAGAVGKVAFAYKANDGAVSLNGAAVVTDSSLSLPSVSACGIGCSPYSSSVNLNGWIRKINYLRTRQDNATLQSMTA